MALRREPDRHVLIRPGHRSHLVATRILYSGLGWTGLIVARGCRRSPDHAANQPESGERDQDPPRFALAHMPWIHSLLRVRRSSADTVPTPRFWGLIGSLDTPIWKSIDLTEADCLSGILTPGMPLRSPAQVGRGTTSAASRRPLLALRRRRAHVYRYRSATGWRWRDRVVVIVI